MKQSRWSWAAFFLVAIFIAFLWIVKQNEKARGLSLNKQAWESSYRERWQAVPDSGPREGYWGSRLGPKKKHPVFGWHERPNQIPTLFSIDEKGLQHYKPAKPAQHRVLILGGSVAWGAYASSVQKTYFHVAGEWLTKKSRPTEIDIMAAGAWKSRQEVAALQERGDDLNPSLVVLINGLNDLTNGSTARALYGEKVPTRDGSEWNLRYHAHDYEARVQDYLANMKKAWQWCQQRRIPLILVLQPSLLEKDNRTAIEEKLQAGSLLQHPSADVLIQSYDQMRQGVSLLAQSANVSFLDASNLFDREKKTLFADLWHFSDKGHTLLGQALAQKIHDRLK